jgi:hypothetical protein
VSLKQLLEVEGAGKREAEARAENLQSLKDKSAAEEEHRCVCVHNYTYNGSIYMVYHDVGPTSLLYTNILLTHMYIRVWMCVCACEFVCVSVCVSVFISPPLCMYLYIYITHIGGTQGISQGACQISSSRYFSCRAR